MLGISILDVTFFYTKLCSLTKVSLGSALGVGQDADEQTTRLEGSTEEVLEQHESISTSPIIQEVDLNPPGNIKTIHVCQHIVD